MKKLHELLRKPLKKGDVGIEIECEGDNLYPIMSDRWKTEADNSLRGDFPNKSCEWVLNNPVPKEEVEDALNELFKSQELNKAKFNFSFRTSVHIHINVGHLTRDQVMAMAYAYYLIEDLMLEYCAEHRRFNRFCLSIGQAEGAIPYIKRMIECQEQDFPRVNPQNAVRYSSLNLEALYKYGSLEFRALEGNADVQRINTWVKALVNIRTFIEQTDDIRDVHDVFLFEGAKRFIERALGDVSEFFKTKGYTNSIAKAFSTTIELPFAYKERIAEPEKLPPPVPVIEEMLVAPVRGRNPNVHIRYEVRDAEMLAINAQEARNLRIREGRQEWVARPVAPEDWGLRPAPRAVDAGLVVQEGLE